MKEGIDALYQKLAPYRSFEFRKIKHLKSGGIYYIVDIHLRESDLSVWFSYNPHGHRHLKFSRPISELTDGRFEFIP